MSSALVEGGIHTGTALAELLFGYDLTIRYHRRGYGGWGRKRDYWLVAVVGQGATREVLALEKV